MKLVLPLHQIHDFMTQDWKDILAAMGGNLPREDNSEEITTTPQPAEVNDRKKDTLHIIIDKKGRKGKTATIIEGFTLPDEEVAELAAELKRKIGTGGSSRAGEILLQGEWKEKVKEFLIAKGYKPSNIKC